jgi:hypothetical protein
MPTNTERGQLKTCVDAYMPDAAAQAESGGPPDFMKSLTAANWETILAGLFPADNLQMLTEDLIDQTFAYLDGESPVVTLSFVDLKTRINGTQGVDAMLELIRAQPECTETQRDPMITAIREGSEPGIFCNPPEDALQGLTTDIQRMLVQTTEELPDERILLDLNSGENTDTGGGLPGALRPIHFVLRVSPLIPLGFLLLVTLLAVRDPGSWLRWWGIPTLIAGILVIISTLFNTILFEQLWITVLANEAPPYLSLGLLELVRGLATALIRRFSMGIVFGGVIITVTGLGLLIGSFFTKKD